MAGKSNIEWTEHTWNPIVGCSIKSPGCGHCYAMRMAHRLANNPATPHYAGTTKMTKAGPVFTGKVAMAPEHILLEPLHRKKPTTWFVNSMGDLFHESVPDEWIDRVFAVMALCPQHTFQVLTKRAERMREYMIGGVQVSRERFDDRDTCIKAQAFLWGPLHRYDDKLKSAISVPLNNVWLGISCERQQEADERIPLLRMTPAAVRFISFEPLLGHIEPDLRGIHWAIAGGESGPDARPMHPKWPRRLRNVCAEHGVAFFFKQWGQWAPHDPQPGGDLGGDVRSGRVRIVHPTGQTDVEVSVATNGHSTIPGSRYMERAGKKAAGRLLDGKEHNGFPATSIPQREVA